MMYWSFIIMATIFLYLFEGERRAYRYVGGANRVDEKIYKGI